MRSKIFALAIMTASGLALATAPAIAEAQQPKRVLVCNNVKKKTTNGAIVGALGGGLAGNVIAGRGDRTEGTLIGAGVGALAGSQIAKSQAKKKRCRYVYR